MVRPTRKDGLPGSHDVPASASDSKLDRKGYRAPVERGFHLAKSVSGVERAFETFWDQSGPTEYVAKVPKTFDDESFVKALPVVPHGSF